MITVEKLINRKLSLLELAEYLSNVSEACRIQGVSRQNFYDIKKAYEEGGIEGLREKSRRKPNLKNRVGPEVEQRVLSLALEYPTYGQMRVSNELRREGILVSPGGVRSIWLRHELQTMERRLKRLEEEVAKTGGVLTEFQKQALEKARTARQNDINSVDTAHPGYLLGQDTFYVGTLKGVGRIYMQSAIDIYFEACLKTGELQDLPLPKRAKMVSNWLSGEFSRLLNATNIEISGSRVKPEQLCQLLGLMQKGSISGTSAKLVFEEMFTTGKQAAEIIGQRGFGQISDTDQISEVASEVIQANPQAVADYKKGKTQSLTFLVGQVMKATRGRANPQLVNELLKKKLEEG